MYVCFKIISFLLAFNFYDLVLTQGKSHFALVPFHTVIDTSVLTIVSGF